MSQSNRPRSSGRKVQRSASRRNIWMIFGLGALILVATISLLLTRSGSAVAGEQYIADQGANLHIQAPTDPHPAYNSNPPTSGYHVGGMEAPWGVQTEPISDEISVHNLEHGGVIIHYRQDIDSATVGELTRLGRELEQQNPCILVQPRAVDKLDVPIAVTAWTYLLKLERLDADVIRAFFKAHVGRGPEPICQP